MMLILRLPGYKNKQKSASKRPCIITDPIKKFKSRAGRVKRIMSVIRKINARKGHKNRGQHKNKGN
jgi:hypothetical protein